MWAYHCSVNTLNMSVFGYWKVRGYAQPIRCMLHYAGEEFTENLYVFGDGPEFSKEEWLKEKFTLGYNFPNLPYYDDGVVRLTQSMAISRYLGRKHNLDGSTVQEKVRIDQVVEEGMDLRRFFVTLCYSTPQQFAAGKPQFLENTKAKFDQLDKYLGDGPWFAGNNISYADFIMYEILYQHKTLDAGLFDKTPKLKAFMTRFEELPAIKKYMASDTYISGPCNNKSATFQ